jgi:hypothetical protein
MDFGGRHRLPELSLYRIWVWALELADSPSAALYRCAFYTSDTDRRDDELCIGNR